MNNRLYRLITLPLLISLSACNTTSKLSPTSHGEMTMSQIYAATAGVDATSVAALPAPTLSTLRMASTVSNNRVNYAGYTRTAQKETDNLFKTLPNPIIPVYIYPHLATEGEDTVPVPGYTTAFYLYQQPQFALPSEVY